MILSKSARDWRRNVVAWVRGRPYGVGFLLALAAWWSIPTLVHDRFLLNIIVLIGLYCLLTLGLSLLVGYAGQISTAQAAFYGIGAYTSAIITTRTGLPIFISMACAVAVPAAIAYIVGYPILKLRHFFLAMATLAFGDIVAILFTQVKGITGGFTGIIGVPQIAIGTFVADTPNRTLYLLGPIVTVGFIVAHRIVTGRIGRALRALRMSEVGASAMGVDVVGYKVKVFAISAAFAGLGGALLAHYVGYVNPESFTGHFSILLIVMLYIGGLRSLWGAVIGATFTVVLPEVLSRYGNIDVIIYGLAVLIVMLFVPGGIAGMLERLRFATLRGEMALPATQEMSVGRVETTRDEGRQ
jgi:branched-chain amino acid transport system permease protein